MKLLLATTLFLCLSGAIGSNIGQHVDKPKIDRIFTVGYEYRYKYSGQVLSGIPDVSPQQAGLGLDGQIVVKAYSAGFVTVQIVNLKSGTVNQELETVDIEEVPFKFGSIGQSEGSMFTPVKVTYSNGLIRAFESDATESEEVTNVKRSILDLLQLKLDDYFNRRSKAQAHHLSDYQVNTGVDDAATYSVMEEGLEGKCENRYTVEVNPWAGNPDAKTLNVTKTLNTDNCLNFVDWLVSTHPANNCTSCDSDDIEVVSNVKYVEYEINLDNQMFVIERIDSVGQTVYTPLSADSDEIQTNHSQSLVLISVKPLGSEPYIALTNTTRYDNLQYDFPDLEEGEKPDEQELVEAPVPFLPMDDNKDFLGRAKQLIEEVSREIDNNAQVPMINTPLKAQQLSRVVRHLSAEEIKVIFDQYIYNQKNVNGKSELDAIKKEVALSAILMSGSLPALSTLVEKVEHNELSNWNQQRVMHELPFYIRRPSVPFLDKVLALAQGSRLREGEQLEKTIWMSFASLVDQSCGPEDSSLPVSPGLDTLCEQADEQRYVLAIGEELEKAKTKEQRVLFVSALAAITSEHVIDVLRPYVTGKKEVSEMVQVLAIRAIGNSASEDPTEVLRLVAPIFSDSDETSILRIAAFGALIETAPDVHFLEKLAAQISDDDDDQLVGFVYNALDNLSNTTHPCLKDVSAHATHALNFIDEVVAGIQDSQLFINDDYDEDLMLGNILSVYTVGNNESFIPRMIEVEFNRSIAGYSQVPLRVTAYIEGLSSIIDRLIGPKGAFEQADVERIVRDTYENETPKNYQDIFNKLDIEKRVDESLSVAIETQLLTTKLNLFYLDAQKIREIVKQGYQGLTMRDLMSSSGAQVNYQRIFNFGTVKYQMPSSLGLPIFVQIKSPAIVNVRGQVSVQINKAQGEFIPTDVTVKANIKPTFSLNIMTTMGVIDPFKKQYVAAGVTSKTYIRLPAEVEIKLNLQDGRLITKVVPKLQSSSQHEARLFSYQVVPFTAIYQYDSFDIVAKDAKPIMVKDKLDEYEFKLSPELTGVGASLKVKSDLFWQDQGSMLDYLFEENTLLSLANFWWATPDYKYREYVARVDAAAASNTEFKMVVDVKYLESTIQHAIKQGRQHKLQGLLGFTTGWGLLPWQCEMTEHDHQSFPDYQSKSDWSSVRRLGELSSKARSYVADKVAVSFGSRSGPLRWGQQDTSSQQSAGQSTYQQIEWNKQNAENILKVNVDLSVQGSVKRSIKSKLILTRNKVSSTDSIDLVVDVVNPAGTPDAFHQICVSGDVKYPKFPCGYASSLKPENIKPIVGKLDITYGQTCTSDKKISLTSVWSKSQQQIEHEKFGNEWFYKQCSEDFKEGQKMSDACEQAVLAVSELKKTVITVDYQNLAPVLLNISYKVDNFLKYYFYNHMSNNPIGIDNGQGKLKVKVIFDSSAASADVKIFKARENTFFHKIYYPEISSYIQPINVRRSWLISAADQLTEGYAPPTCKLMSDYVESFDNVTYQVELSECKQVLAKDCSASDLFSVLVKSTGQRFEKQLDINLLNHKIQIQPKQPHTGQFDVMVDNSQVMVSRDQVTLIKSSERNNKVIAVIVINGDRIVVSSPYKQLIVKFDGENVKVKVSNTWRGSLCGLCGEFEGDSSNALIGPKQCEYVDTKDFSRSYTLPSSQCTPKTPSSKKTCPDQQSPTYGRQFDRRQNSDSDSLVYKDQQHYKHSDKLYMDNEDSYVPNSVKRQLKLQYSRDELCFSIESHPKCKEGYVPVSTITKTMKFYCFPDSQKSFAQGLLRQINDRELHELSGKEVSRTAERKIPTSCSRMYSRDEDSTFSDEDATFSDKVYSDYAYADTQSSRRRGQQSTTDVPNSVYRNVQLPVPEDLCFSTIPLAQCLPGFKATETENQQVPFHCFRESERDRVNELQQRMQHEILYELEGQSVTETKTISVITVCSEVVEPLFGDSPSRRQLRPIVPNSVLRNREVPFESGCFSINSFPKCSPGFQAQVYSFELAPFHCFPQEDINYIRQLRALMPKQELTQLIGTSVSKRLIQFYPTRCVRGSLQSRNEYSNEYNDE